jgi:hypothetical protein
MGHPLKGTIHIERPEESTRRSIDLRGAEGTWFAPRITNASGVPLTVAIESTNGWPECQCEVATAGAPVWLGYYQLGEGTTVRVRDASGREAVFDGLGDRRDQLGQVALRIEKRDLPYPVAMPRPAARPATRSQVYAANAPAPVVAETPAQPVVVTEVESLLPPEPQPEPVPAEPAPAPTPAKRSSSPSFLPN